MAFTQNKLCSSEPRLCCRGGLIDCLKPEHTSAPSQLTSHYLPVDLSFPAFCFVCGWPQSSFSVASPPLCCTKASRDERTNRRQREVKAPPPNLPVLPSIFLPCEALCQTSFQALKSSKSTHCRIHCHLAELGHSSTLGGQILLPLLLSPFQRLLK